MEFVRGMYDWWVKFIDFPALILLLIFTLGLYVMYRTQKADNGFDFSEMLRDEYGKPSAGRLAMFVCLAITTWGFMFIIMKNGTIDTMLFLGYAAIWSGAKVAETAIVAYANRGKPDSPYVRGYYGNRQQYPQGPYSGQFQGPQSYQEHYQQGPQRRPPKSTDTDAIHLDEDDDGGPRQP